MALQSAFSKLNYLKVLLRSLLQVAGILVLTTLPLPADNTKSADQLYSEVFYGLYDLNRIVLKPPFVKIVSQVFSDVDSLDIESNQKKLALANRVLRELNMVYRVQDADFAIGGEDVLSDLGISLEAFEEDREFLQFLVSDDRRRSVLLDIFVLMIPMLHEVVETSGSRILGTRFSTKLTEGISQMKPGVLASIELRARTVGNELELGYVSDSDQTALTTPENSGADLSFDDILSNFEVRQIDWSNSQSNEVAQEFITSITRVASADGFRVSAIMNFEYLAELTLLLEEVSEALQGDIGSRRKVVAGLRVLRGLHEKLSSAMGYVDRVEQEFPGLIEDFSQRQQSLEQIKNDIQANSQLKQRPEFQNSLVGNIDLMVDVYNQQIRALGSRQETNDQVRQKIVSLLSHLLLRISYLDDMLESKNFKEWQQVVEKNSDLEKAINQIYLVVKRQISSREASPLDVRSERLIDIFIGNEMSSGVTPVAAIQQIIERQYRRPRLYQYLKSKLMESSAGNTKLYLKAFLALYPDHLEDIHHAFSENFAPKAHHASVSQEVYRDKIEIFRSMLGILSADALLDADYLVLLRNARIQYEKSYKSQRYPLGRGKPAASLEDLIYLRFLNSKPYRNQLSCQTFLALGGTLSGSKK